MFVALSIPDWPTGAAAIELPAALLAIAPRATLAPGERLAWLDARGLDPEALIAHAHAALTAIGVTIVAAGVSAVPIVAAIAAREPRDERREGEGERTREHGSSHPSGPAPSLPPSFFLSVVSMDAERQFLAPLPLDVVTSSLRLLNLFHGVGLACCGDLARLPREAVEVRFGRDGLAAWRWARADDPRPLFTARPRELPNASLDWTEFSTSDVEQLVFVLHSLLKTVCDALLSHGLGAQALTLTLTLENRTTLVQPVGAARVTAQRTTWLRLMRRALEKLALPDRVTGIAVQVDSACAPTLQQGDLFDLGFATALAAENAVGQILDLQGDAVVELQVSGHVVRERRVKWETAAMSDADVTASQRVHAPAGPTHALMTPGASLTPSLHPTLLPSPREITVLTHARGGFDIPVRYLDNGTPVSLPECLGPECLSGEQWGDAFAREYYQGVRADGVVVLMYRDVAREQWYLSGWWD